jgi:hypothetical protein
MEALEAADRINERHGRRIIEVFVAEEIGCSVPILRSLGLMGARSELISVDMHAMFPDRSNGLAYVRSNRGYDRQPNLDEMVKRVMDYDAVVTVLHPGEKMVHGMPLTMMEDFLGNYAARYPSRVWVEGVNWLARLFPGRRKVEDQAIALAEKYQVGCVFSSDAHRVGNIGNVMTGYPLGERFVPSVKRRETFPVFRRRLLQSLDRADLLISGLVAQYNSYVVNPDFLVPLDRS